MRPIYKAIYDDAIMLLSEIEPYLVINEKKLCRLIFDKYKQITPKNERKSDELRLMKEQFYKGFMAL
ncbi:hypothetical protein [Proteiniborus sp. DW1]|uniref:hypothetical protein n=1 Tax=Proteiniborus sp. DW1 TaxID=1889883 RepID=UPI000942C567|nr:hypothetical protein [Proteiniborus sp. DW1]